MTRKFTNRQIIFLVWQQLKINKWQALNNTVVGMFIVGLEFLFVWLTKQTIDIATGTSHLFTLKTSVILLGVTMLTQLLLTAYRSWVNAMLSVKATNRLQLDIFHHTLLTPWASIRKFHSADIVNRIEKDVNVIVSLVTDTLPSLIITCTQFCGAFTFLYLMDKKLALFVVIIIPFFILIGKLYIRRMRRLSRKIRETDSRLQSQYQEGVRNTIVIKTIRSATKAILQGILQTQSRIVGLVHQRALYSVTSNFVMNIGFASAYMFTFVWGTYHLSIGLISYGALIAFVQLVNQIQRPARGLVRFIPDIISALTSGERILQVSQLQTEQTPQEESARTADGALGVRVSNVTFGYTYDRDILEGITLDFPPGSRTAIVAPTGRGKTTLIRLMLSLLTPRKGQIEIYGNGHSLPTSTATRHLFAYVPQGNTLFSGSIRSNLKIANPDADDAQLIESLRLAGADFVLSLPEGLSSECGEHGVSLSEGQSQRLSIARCLLTGAPILLLDEATSALDETTESEVMHRILTAMPHATIICITHRKGVVRFCDKLVEL